MSNSPEPIERPVYPTAPNALKAMSTEALAGHYVHLDEIKLAGETRVGRHPSGRMFVEAMEHDARVREVLDAGLTLIVREMAAVRARRVADPLDRWGAGGLATDRQKLKRES